MLNNKYFTYQPNFLEQSIVSYEALLRIKGSNELPSDFLSTIEDNESFDKAVISHIISDKLSLKNSNSIHISINISVKSLESNSFIEYCESVFKLYKGFSFELNFKHQNVNLEKIRSNMLKLKKLGLFFTLDDYGTEYKHSDPLLELDFDYIKIDQSLINPIDEDYLSFCFLRSIYHKLNTFLGNKVIIKGIETVNQFNLVNSLGSVISQGYHLSYPLPITDVDQNYESQKKPFKNELAVSNPPIDRYIYNINISKNQSELNASLSQLKLQDPFNLLGIDYNNFDLHALNRRYQELLEGIKTPSILFTTNLMQHCNCLFILRDEHGVTIYNNKKHSDYLGCDLVGMSVPDVLQRFPDYQTCLQLDQQLLNNKSDILMSDETVEVGSSTMHFHTYRQKIKYFDKSFVMVFVYEDKQDVQAPIDSLTGCFTRAKLNHIDINAYNTIVFLDLDGFKNINDQYGHQFGDQQLKKTARLINQSLRKEDLLIRFGGDEFVLCFNSHSIQDINTKMRMIRTTIETYFQENNLYLSYSFGVAPLEMDIQTALESADKQMYINKRKRKKNY